MPGTVVSSGDTAGNRINERPGSQPAEEQEGWPPAPGTDRAGGREAAGCRCFFALPSPLEVRRVLHLSLLTTDALLTGSSEHLAGSGAPQVYHTESATVSGEGAPTVPQTRTERPREVRQTDNGHTTRKEQAGIR